MRTFLCAGNIGFRAFKHTTIQHNMRIQVRVSPGKKESRLEIIDGVFAVELKERAEKNKANIALIKLLAKHFKVSSSDVKIKKGLTSRNKVIEIEK